jgi:transposase
MEVKRIGVDLVKNVSELYGVDAGEKRVLRKTVCQGTLLAIFAELAPCVAGMDARGSAHYWALVLAPAGGAIETGQKRRDTDYAVGSV